METMTPKKQRGGSLTPRKTPKPRVRSRSTPPRNATPMAAAAAAAVSNEAMHSQGEEGILGTLLQ
jgi:hypothetical protein